MQKSRFDPKICFFLVFSALSAQNLFTVSGVSIS